MKDQIIREIKLIERYSRHNEDEDFRFRNFYKYHLNLSNSNLDAVVQEITDEVWKQIDCTTCANCCKTLQVIIDDKDISRLAVRLGMTVSQFSHRYVRTAADGLKHFASMPCPFLDANNLCSVYEDRPQACRDYPFLYNKDFRDRSLTMIENTAVCPIVFNVWKSLKQRLWPHRRKG